ncbi:MAG: hypothetical protein LBU56_01465 [Rickettsiales bacterium]|jgi:hypothetical protein|nr:hypothetical protein [Rickettsiales bacterium]
MDKKASSSSQGDSRFKVGSGGYDSAAWMAANCRTGGGGRDMHEGRSRFDDYSGRPYPKVSNTKAEKAQSSRQKY